jgi:hypothetical protein
MGTSYPGLLDILLIISGSGSFSYVEFRALVVDNGGRSLKEFLLSAGFRQYYFSPNAQCRKLFEK